MNRAIIALVAALPAALAGAGCHRAEGQRAIAQAECAACTDPETEAGSYVSIGVMPAPYPISWQSPYDLFVTTIGTVAASTGLDRSHSIGHVLLKVRCGTSDPVYISQTGANDKAAKQFWGVYDKGPNYLFETHTDGKLYSDAEAADDWNTAIEAQKKLDGGTYTTDPDPSAIDHATVLKALRGMPTVMRSVRDLPPATRHRFVRATIRITDDQCRAILAWRDDYVATGGSSRYSVHRAPWVMDSFAKYDGGGCASVGFAGAFYAAGLDYKRASSRTIERLAIGTSRLTSTIYRDARKQNGWFNVQNPSRYVPGNIPVSTRFMSHQTPWFDNHWKSWNGGMTPRPNRIWEQWAKDEPLTFSKQWGTHKDVEAAIVPLIIFEPERFYKEILGRWNSANYDAFTYPDWCKIDGKVPTIVLDARNLTGAGEAAKGRPKGLVNGFANRDVMLPLP